MLFTDIANYKKSLDNALTPFNENIKTKILLNKNKQVVFDEPPENK